MTERFDGARFAGAAQIDDAAAEAALPLHDEILRERPGNAAPRTVVRAAWRHAAAQGQPAVGFVQVELTPSAPPSELIVELGGGVRLRLTAPAQLALAAGLLQHLRAATPC